jgi:DNA-directed RNA polymerase I subunit RPA49
MPTAEQLQSEVDAHKPRPKHNPAATVPADIYKIEDLVGVDILPRLAVRQWEEKVERKEEILTNFLFVSSRVVSVVNSKNVKKLRALKFLLIMLQWYHCLKTGFRTTKKLPPRAEVEKAVPDVDGKILDSIRRRFAPEKYALDSCATGTCLSDAVH